MRKFIIVLCAAVCLLLCGCGEKYKCQLCGDEYIGEPNEYKTGGETYILCDKCFEPFDK